jgi:hypothetical protein
MGKPSVAYRRSLTTVVGLGLAFSLVVSSRVGAQPLSATPAAPPSDAQIRSELRRLNTMRTTCLAEAQQAVALQRTASAGGRLSDGEAYGQTLKDKMACVDKANQELVRLQTQAGPAKAALFVSEDRFHQEYRQGLQAQLGALQRLSLQLAGHDTVTYEMFARQMDALRRQTDAFKNRYIRLLNEPDTQELAKAVFQASDLLVASAQTWKAQGKAELDIAELAPNGPSAQLARAEAARDTARTQRARDLGGGPTTHEPCEHACRDAVATHPPIASSGAPIHHVITGQPHRKPEGRFW